jgi:hypothetical protein
MHYVFFIVLYREQILWLRLFGRYLKVGGSLVW